jgi:hypothetical protein
LLRIVKLDACIIILIFSAYPPAGGLKSPIIGWTIDYEGAPIAVDFFAMTAGTHHGFAMVPEPATVFVLCFGAIIVRRKR